MQRIVFRADASASIGGGHVMRCLALADALRRDGAECWFAATPESFEAVPALRKSGHRMIEVMRPRDADELGQVVASTCDWLVVDHYGWSAVVETPCRSWAQKIVVIDDLADRKHDCDLLLDQTFGRDAADYSHLVPANCHLLTGSQYALLRPEFAQWRAKALARRKSPVLRRAVVSMGLSDPSNLTLQILQGILESKLPLTVDVVLGPSAPGLSSVRQMVGDNADRFTLHVGTNRMAELLTECDVCFGAAGSSSWERCCLGVPTIMALIADNQNEIAARLVSEGAVVSIGSAEQVSSDDISRALRALAQDTQLAVRLSVTSMMICDGRGVERVTMRLRPALSAKDMPVWLRPVLPTDLEVIYAWQAQPETRRLSRNSAVPTPEEHRQWFFNRLKNPASLFSIIVLDGLDVGILRLDQADETSYEVSIVVSNQYYGQGIGSCTLELARRLIPEARINAEILPGNVRSETLFTRAGYLPTGYGWRSIGPLSETRCTSADFRRA